MSVCSTFLLVESLSSLDSAKASVALLFAEVAGTTDSSGFLLVFMPDFPSETFSDRSAGWCHCHQFPTETNRASRFSRLKYPRMPRFADSAVSVEALPIAAATMWPSPCQDKIGTRKWCRVQLTKTGELNGWPTLPFARTLKTVPLPELPLR